MNNTSYYAHIGLVLEEITNGWERNPIGRFISCTDGTRNIQIRTWGEDNQTPVRWERLVEQSNMMPSLLDTKGKITMGQRFYCYTQELDEKGNPYEKELPFTPEERALLRNSPMYFETALAYTNIFGNVPVRFKRSDLAQNGKHPIVALRAENPKYWRKERQNKQGIVENVWFRGDAWLRGGKATSLPLYDIDLPMPEGNFVAWYGKPILFADGYYYGTLWQGAETWLQLLAAVPKFHISNINNIYAPTMHVRIKKGYFLPKGYADATEPEKKVMRAKEKTDREAFLRDINNRVSGLNNAGRVIWSEQDVKSLESKYPDIDFIPINLTNNEKSFMELYQTAERAVMSSVQIGASIANIFSEGSHSSGSMQVYELLQHRVIHNQSTRDLLLQPWYLAAQENGWDANRCYGFKDVDLVARNESKSGQKDVNNNG